jgi:murein DD-endopeptidase MepM/ murein hydrolase activator NlpD
MRRRRPRTHYTLWLARSGTAPRTLSLPAWLPVLVVLFLIAWSGLNLYLWNQTRIMGQLELERASLAQQARRLNNQLSGEQTRNDTLAAQAKGTFAKLNAIETEINKLRERAGLPKKTLLTPARDEGGPKGGGTSEVSDVGLALKFIDQESVRLTGDLREVSPALDETLQREAAVPSGFPVYGHTRIASGFGYRRSPFGWWRYEFHDGLDFPAPYGTTVHSTGAGRVVQASYHKIFGLSVTVDHGYGLRTLYGHLQRLAVSQGQEVERGQRLGWVGSTGRSTGPHLHYTVTQGGKAVSPRGYLY